MPTTARNQRGATPVSSVSIACVLSISRRIRAGGNAQNHAEGWVALWLPRVCPRRTISPISCGIARAFSPTTKNVAFAECASSMSSIAAVCADGPSSMVSHTTRSWVGNRVSTGLSSRDCGRNVAHTRPPWLSSIAGSPARQPQTHHSATIATCDATNQPTQT